jgi:hypothetical protein
MIDFFETEVKEYISEEGCPEFFIEFPPEIINHLGWEEGDTIVWEILNDVVTISKKEI